MPACCPLLPLPRFGIARRHDHELTCMGLLHCHGAVEGIQLGFSSTGPLVLQRTQLLEEACGSMGPDSWEPTAAQLAEGAGQLIWTGFFADPLRFGGARGDAPRTTRHLPFYCTHASLAWTPRSS